MRYQLETQPVKIHNTLSFSSKLTPAHITDGKKIEIDILKLTELPKVMRSMKWSIASKLMDRWFQGDAFILEDDLRKQYDDYPLSIPEAHYDDKIVTMNWALGFDRFKKSCDSAIKNYYTENSIHLLSNKLIKLNWPLTTPILGNTSMTARELNATCQIQTELVGSTTDTIDDFYGAIGKGCAQLAVVGHVQRDKFSELFIIEHVGLYLKDCYEFTDLIQFLGCWTKSKALGKAEMLAHASDVMSLDGTRILQVNEPVFHVFNHHFRQYREKHGKGGDFVVYSDVMWLPGDGFLPIRLDKEHGVRG